MSEDRTMTMSAEYKKALYNYFFKDVPVPFESVNDEQFKALSNTLVGSQIAAGLAIIEIGNEIKKSMVGVAQAINNMFGGSGK